MPKLSEALYPKSPNTNEELLQTCVAFITASFAVFLMYISWMQSSYWPWTTRLANLNIEEALVATRLPTLLLFFFLGFSSTAFRAKLAEVGGFVFSALYGQEKIAWPVQAAVAFALLIGIIFSYDPRLLDKLTSFKAGEVEAHFGDSSSRIRSGNTLRFAEIAQSSTLSKWRTFELIPLSKDDDSSYRYRSYLKADADIWRVKLAHDILDGELKQLFVLSNCFDAIDELSIIKNDPEMAALAFDFEQLIEDSSGQRSTSSGTDEAEALKWLEANAKRIADRFAGILSDKMSRSPFFVRKVEAFNSSESAQGNNLNQASCPVIRSDNAYKLQRVARDSQAEVKELITKHAAETKFLWDPYIIVAIADLLDFTSGQSERAKFLEILRSKGINKNTACSKTQGCKYAPAGLTTFYYYINDAKVKSEGSWPIEEMSDDMRTAINWVQELLAAKDAREDRVSSLKQHYRNIKLIDLGLGLEIFYRQALSDNKLRTIDRILWSQWLEETRQALTVISGVGIAPNLTTSERLGWMEAAPTIEKTPITLFDAATAAALSLVLLPEQTDQHPTSEACLQAKTLHLYAASLGKSISDSLSGGPNVTATLQGFVSQVGARVDAECAL